VSEVVSKHLGHRGTSHRRTFPERLERLELRRRSRGTVPLAPGQCPEPSLPAGTDRLPQIKHIVVLMMENHSYDN
jgi:phospholipase C